MTMIILDTCGDAISLRSYREYLDQDLLPPSTKNLEMSGKEVHLCGCFVSKTELLLLYSTLTTSKIRLYMGLTSHRR